MKIIMSLLSLGILTTLTIQSSFANQLSNFNEPNTEKLKSAMQNHKLQVIQFGDSHTAADVFTGSLRTQLQNSLGDGGMGWGMPMYFTGHRLSLYGYDNSGWQPISSRTQQNENYSLGGLIAIPKFSGATLTIKAKQAEQPQSIIVSIRQGASDGAFSGQDASGRTFSLEAPVKNNTWQTAKFNATLPFTITANNASQSAIAGWWAQNQNGGGAVVSALGINGAELSNWNRWNSGWQTELNTLSPNLVILAYGTNEAYNNADVDQARDNLVDKIQKIRRASPNTAIMIISAPESLKGTSGECGTRPSKLSSFQSMQYQVAQSQQTLYWDWQKAMGGECSMKRWMNQGLALKDGVHFSPAGYEKLGQFLANDLLNLSGVPISQSSSRHTTSTNSNQSVSYNKKSNYEALGFAQICLEDSNECKSIGK